MYFELIAFLYLENNQFGINLRRFQEKMTSNLTPCHEGCESIVIRALISSSIAM